MKFWLLIIFLIYATNLIKDADSVSQSGQELKLNKTFDEIYGKGWDEEVPEFTENKEWHKKETQTTEVENKLTDQDNANEQSFSDHYESFANRKIRERFDEMFDENWEEDVNNSVPSADDLDQENSREAKHLSDQNNSTDQDESVDKQQNESNECEKIESDQRKREITQKFREIKNDYKKKRKYSKNEWYQIERKISNGLGVCRSTIYNWSKELGLSRKTKFSELEKSEILKQFDRIKSKCKQAKLENISTNELNAKIAKKLGVCSGTIFEWKRKFGLSVRYKRFSELEKREILKQFDKIKSKCKQAKFKYSNELDNKIANKFGVSKSTIYEWKCEFGLSVGKKQFSDATKIGILKKYAKIKRKNPKMPDCDIVDLLKISSSSLLKWKAQFSEQINVVECTKM